MTKHDWLIRQSALPEIEPVRRATHASAPSPIGPRRSRTRRAFRFGSRLLVLAVGTMLVAAIGVGGAAIPDSTGVIHACYSKSGGDDDDGGKGRLRVIDTEKGVNVSGAETIMQQLKA